MFRQGDDFARFVEFERQQLRETLTRRVADHMGEQLHTVKFSEYTQPDYFNQSTKYVMLADIEPAMHRHVDVFEPAVTSWQEIGSNDRHYLHGDGSISTKAGQRRCGYCNGMTPNDAIGACQACGAPRDK